MKRILLLLLFISSLGFSQSSGITYQAVIYNPNGEELPGIDNPYAPLTNQDVCLQFGIVDADGNVEYQEEVQVTTDAFGMVNLLIGTNSQTGGYAADFAGVEWSADAKFLKVDLDIKGNCTDFEELSYQPFTYVPFAYYSPASDVPGPEGPQGPAGANGQDGNDGQDGATGPAGSTGQAGPAGPNGQDGAVGATGPTGPSGPAGPQGDQGPQGEQGPAGDDGEAGIKTLINTSDEAAGDNCANGGVKIEVGEDANADGILDTDEVDDSLTRYICNGLDGQDGSDGQDGAAGPQGVAGVNGSSGIDLGNVEGSLKFKRIETYTEFDLTVPTGEIYLLKSIYRLSSNSINPAFRVEINGNSTIHSAKYDKFDGNTSSIRPNYMSPNIYLAPNTRIYDAVGELFSEDSIEGVFTFFVYEYPNNFDVLNLTAYDIQNGSDFTIPQGKLANIYQVTQGHNYSDDPIYNSLYFSDNVPGSGVTNTPIQWGNQYDDSLTFQLNAFLPSNWSISSGDSPVGHFYTLFIYDESIIVNDENPPSDLQVCDFWGGGIVFYIAQIGDPIYVEGEIHGLIAPPYWTKKGFGSYSYNALSLTFVGNYTNVEYYQNNAVNQIGGGEINNLIYQSIFSASSYDNTPFGFCENLVLNGFSDWYFPCLSELSLYFSLNTYCPEIGDEFIKGYFQHSGYYFSAFDGIIPSYATYNTNCCSDQTRLVPIRKF